MRIWPILIFTPLLWAQGMQVVGTSGTTSTVPCHGNIDGTITCPAGAFPFPMGGLKVNGAPTPPSPAPLLTATFYPEQVVSVPATGQPITILRVDLACAPIITCPKVNPIEIFRANPMLNPLTVEMAKVQLALKTSRTPLQITGRLLTLGASASTVITGIQTFIHSARPGQEEDAKSSAKWALVSAGAAFISQYAPALGRQIVGAAPMYEVPADTLSSRPLDLAMGEAVTVHVVSWGEGFGIVNGVVR